MSKLRWTAGFAAALAAVALGSATAVFSVRQQSVSYAATDEIYDSFDDYDVGYDRNGRAGGIYAQIETWGSASGTNVAEAGDPVGSETGKSLRLKQKSNGMYIAWGKGMKDAEILNQNGAKYVRCFVRNLSSEARGIGLIVTDVLQSTVDSFATAGNRTPDSGQEHWQLGWNRPAVLETLDGEKSVARAVNGSYVTIPAGFEGTISMPLDQASLARPDWWLQEGHDYANGKLDLERIFMTSIYFPELTDGIEFDDPDSWSVFEVDNVAFCSDDSVGEYLEENGGGDDTEAKNVVRPKTDEIEVDFAALTISVKSGMTKDAFVNGFVPDPDVKITLKDAFGFVVADGTQKLEENYVAEFGKGLQKFTFRLRLMPDAPPTESGCGSSVGTGWWIGAATLLGTAGLLALRKKKSVR